MMFLTKKRNHNKVPMRRQDRQKVKRWLAELHPDANEYYKFRDGSYFAGTVLGINRFPTNEAAIRRFFAWCHRHKLPADSRLSYCLYWGVCEPDRSSTFKTPAIFRDFSPAMLENLFGKVTNWLSTEDNDRCYRDSWEIVAEYFTKDEDFLVGRWNPDTRYDQFGEKISESPGRFFKANIRFHLESSEMFGYQDGANKRYSVSNRLKVNFKPRISGGHKVTTKLELTPRGANIADIFEAIINIQLKEKPHKWSVRCQPYAYRSGKLIRMYRARQEGRWWNRHRRHQRRAQARGEANS